MGLADLHDLSPIDKSMFTVAPAADQAYLDLTNRSRHCLTMTFLNPPKMLDPKMPTKWAILNVLTTKCWIASEEVNKLLEQHGVRRSASAIRHSLKRITVFGLAISQKRYKDRYGRKEFKLTQAGYQLDPNPPAKPVKTPKPKRARATKASKGTPARTANMCSDPTKPTLNKVIEDTIFEKTSALQPFSAHDITKAVREKVLADRTLVDQAETGAVHVRAQIQRPANPGYQPVASDAVVQVTGHVQVAKIEHEYVRDVLAGLFHAGTLAGYDRAHNGTYLVYSPPIAVTNPAPVADPDPSGGTPPAASGSSYDGDPVL